MGNSLKYGFIYLFHSFSILFSVSFMYATTRMAEIKRSAIIYKFSAAFHTVKNYYIGVVYRSAHGF